MLSKDITTGCAPLRFGILGTGEMASVFAADLAGSAIARVCAVASRDGDRARRLVRSLPGGDGGIRCHDSYAGLLDDDRVDAVYVALPHSMHAEWALRSVQAGRHVLVEKPLATNAPDAMMLCAEARARGVIVAEALMYRLHPQTAQVVATVRAGAIGDVELLRASFSFAARDLPHGHRLLDPALGGGAILDVGVYPASFARLLCAAALGRPAEPEQITAVSRRHPVTGVDTYSSAALRYPGGIVAELAAGIGPAVEDEVAIYGSTGTLRVREPAWRSPHARGGPTELSIERDGMPAERMPVACAMSSYRLEAEAMARAATADPRPVEVPELPLSDTVGTLTLLDRWAQAAGSRTGRDLPLLLRRPPARRTPVTPREAEGRRLAQIGSQRVCGLARPLSQMVLGCDHQPSDAHLAMMLEAFVSRGGSTVDTAFNYDASMCSGDDCERRLGRCLDAVGVRDDVTLLTKGAHTPDCFPGVIRPQLLQSLERLGTGAVDVYLVHRDNPDVPVDEFVDALDELVHEGLARTVGMSNWSLARFAAAHDDARERRRRAPALISNQFSLADMATPLWPGSYSASTADWRAWLTAHTDVVLAGWSSLARGYLLAPDDGPPAGPVWDTAENRARRGRLRTFARQRHVTPAAAGVAYVLHQPFPTLALIGPRSLGELTSTLEALEVPMSSHDVRHLQHGQELP